MRLTAANDSWTPAFLHKDHLGSVRAISGPDGTPEERTLYRPYGAQSEVVTATLSDDKSGLGERYDAGAGLQYLNARYYDPELAMFLQPDWFEVMQPGVGTNRYAYANGDPINRLDPGGNSTLGSTLSDFFESLFSGLGLGGNHSSADAAENASKVGQGIADSTINHPVVHDIAITLGVVAGVTAGVTAVVAAAELAAVATPTAYMLGLEIGTAEATGMTLGAGVVTKGVSELADDALAIATRSASASTASKAASAADEAAGAARNLGGTTPAPGTRARPQGIPEDWRIRPSESPGGVKYSDPRNPGNQVRVEQGNPASAFPNSRGPYVRDLRNGQYRDINGNIVSRRDPAGHIPLDKYPGYQP